MNRDQFDALVQRLERRYAGRPRALRACVMAWVTVGYLVLIGWLPILLLGGPIALLGRTAFAPASVVWLCLGAVVFAIGLIQCVLLLRIRVAPPQGIVVTRQTAGGLFDELDRLSDAIDCRHFNRVHLTPDLNAGVHRVPRLGLLGWSRISLSIGWPLLMTLNRAEASAVLAHEFAHLSREHGRFGHWLYGLHQMWQTIMLQLRSGERSATARRFLKMLEWFLAWFWPRLNARMFLLSRGAEYEADRQAAEVTSAECLASALWRIDSFTLVLQEQFWPEMRRLAAESPQPPDDYVQRLQTQLARRPDEETAERWLEQVCRELTDQVNTHPSFVDRIAALGFAAEQFIQAGFPALPSPSARDALFSTSAAAFDREISLHWQEQCRDDWRRRHGRSAVLHRRLRSLDSAPAAPGADATALWEKARVLADVSGLEAAEGVLRQLLEARPAHVPACLMLGQHLLARQSLEGVDLLRRVLVSDQDDAVPQAGELLADYFRRTGESAELKMVRRQIANFEAEVQKSRQERSQFKRSDKFLPHDLSTEELQPLVALLDSKPEAGRAWLAQKALRHLPHRRLFVLCVEAQRQGWRANSQRDQQLATSLISQVQLPGQSLVIAQAGSFAGVAKSVKRVEGSLFYARDEQRPE